MHKGVILLTKAENKEDALDQVREFLEPYGDGDVWDWYAIGGRWNNTLIPFKKEWHAACEAILTVDEHGFISQSQVDEKQLELQAAWEELGLLGLNAYTNHYHLPTDGNTYDVMRLSYCIDTVEDWVREDESDELLERVIEERRKEKESESNFYMSAYYARKFADALDKNFSFDSNVYDITREVGEELPEDIEGYWAVMVDLHN